MRCTALVTGFEFKDIFLEERKDFIRVVGDWVLSVDY